MTVRLLHVRLPLRRPLRTATGTIEARETVLVALSDGDLTGWGEAAPYPGQDTETLDTVWEALVVGDDPLPPTAAAAADAARWDLDAPRAGAPLWAHLGGSGTPPRPSTAIGIGEPDATVDAVRDAMANGCAAIKLKIEPGWAVEPVVAVSRVFPELVIGCDANGSFHPTDADEITALEGLGVAYIEQPFANDALAAHAELRATLGDMEVVLDESIDGEASARAALDAQAADRLCLKPGRLGITRSLSIATEANEAGVGVKFSGLIESMVGRATVYALARLPGAAHNDVAPPGSYLTRDVGTFDADRPGSGVSLRADLDPVREFVRG